MQTFFKIDVLKNFAIFTGKHLCWILSLIKLQAFKLLLKRDSNTDVFLWILQNFWEQLFYRTSQVAASKGLHDGFFIGQFTDSGKLYKQLELEYLNQRRWWDVYVCFMVLLNVECILLNTSGKNSCTYIFSCRTVFSKMLLPLEFVNEWNKPDSDIRSSSPEGVFRNASLNIF